MKTKGIVISLVLIILFFFIPANLSEAEEQNQKVVLCFYNGNEYLELAKNARLALVAGLSDMANTLIQYYEPKKYKKIYELVRDMTLGQKVKILYKYLEEHPEKLHNSVAGSFLNAIDEIVFKE